MTHLFGFPARAWAFDPFTFPNIHNSFRKSNSFVKLLSDLCHNSHGVDKNTAFFGQNRHIRVDSDVYKYRIFLQKRGVPAKIYTPMWNISHPFCHGFVIRRPSKQRQHAFLYIQIHQNTLFKVVFYRTRLKKRSPTVVRIVRRRGGNC